MIMFVRVCFLRVPNLSIPYYVTLATEKPRICVDGAAIHESESESESLVLTSAHMGHIPIP